jgi:glucokinase
MSAAQAEPGAVLAADIGGTKTIVALYEESGAGLRQRREETYASREHQSFEQILERFRPLEGGPLRAACFDVAGPVADGRSRVTNLPWELDERRLASQLGTPRVKLLNDLEATAYGMLHLTPEQICSLNVGQRPARKGHVAVIAAGTGLGEALLYWDGAAHHPTASEGGHADFAPRNEQETQILRFLRSKLGGRVSYERVLSGGGLFEIYSCLRELGVAPEPPWLGEALRSGDRSATVSRGALERKDPLCAAALEQFCALYGAEAGNMALRSLTVGGVFIGGGIAPKILPALQGGAFMQAFLDKGRFADYLRAIDVQVSLNDRAALLGASNFALRL